MKILLYNYVQPDNPTDAGGGVTIYLRNLIASLRVAGHDVITLASGTHYDLTHRMPRLAQQHNGELFIVNSPVVAPSLASSNTPLIFVNNEELDSLATRLTEHIGRPDVIHFHNVEGLSAGFIRSLRLALPDAAFLYSAHNYQIVCPQGKLWRGPDALGEPDRDGTACAECITPVDSRALQLRLYRLRRLFALIGLGSPAAQRRIKSLAARLPHMPTRQSHSTKTETRQSLNPAQSAAGAAERAAYRAYRECGLNLVNHVFDRTLAVSARTAAILTSLGADPARVGVSYIGTRFSDIANPAQRRKGFSINLHVAYLGYMQAEKGFHYFLAALQRLHSDVASSIDVTVAARFTDRAAVHALQALAPEFHSLRLLDGYTHASLATLLAPVHLGIVPPLWEDNLPQVAIEFVTHGVPILTSNKGGAREIAGNPAFVFDVSDPDALANKIIDVVRHKLDLATFWDNEPLLRTNAQHAEELLAVYKNVIEQKNNANAHASHREST